MARRRKKNPLLTRIIVVSVAVHIVALPILAKFGAFKKIKREYLETQMVKLPPPPVEKQKPEVKKQQAKVVHKSAASKTASAAHAGPRRSNPNAPHVAVAQGNGTGDDSGPTVDQGNGKAGVLPTAVKPKTEDTGTPQPTTTTPTPQPTQPEKVVKNTEPVKTTTPEPVKPAEPAAPHIPVVVEAEPTNSPQPTIPDDLRSDAIDKTCVAEVTVSETGMPVSVKISQSSGNSELDALAMDTAKRWRFKPATSDGVPVQSTVRLHIEFQVS
jgi:protein TonB